jgi:hypothetical protein
MTRLPIFPLALAAVFLASLQSLPAAWSAQDSIQGAAETWSVPQKSRPTVFHDSPLDFNRSIRLLSPEQMSEADRNLEAEAESSVAEHAGFADIAFNEGKWAYGELVCPAFPNHMFLRFTRNNGVGDVSVFSASVPRNGEGRVRIIPIQRRGYSLFSPAPINAMTISAFNRIRSEEQTEAADWAGMALCYAALAGANPQIGPSTALSGGRTKIDSMGPVLANQPDGGAIIHLTDEAAQPRPMEWSLIFNAKGRLVKAAHAPAPVSATRNVPASDGKQATTPVPGGPYRMVNNSASQGPAAAISLKP